MIGKDWNIEALRRSEKPLLIFDYDGTIQETIRIYYPAVRETVRQMTEEGITGFSPSLEELTPARVSRWLGMTEGEMWREFFPGAAPALMEKYARLIGKHMEEIVQSGGARWYEGMEDVLDGLKEAGYPMMVLSNCAYPYAKLHWEYFRMSRRFLNFADSASFGNPGKGKILHRLGVDTLIGKEASSHTIAGTGTRAIVIGDRASDAAGARAVGAAFIGCLYGYGTAAELAGADALAKDARDIAEAVQKLAAAMEVSL